MTPITQLRAWFGKPVRFDHMGRFLTPGTRLLDVGCGDFAPYSTFKYYPSVIFSGIDWHNIAGRKDMEHFFQCDLEKTDLAEVPNNYYDVINLSHIIEHVSDGGKLLSILVSKLKSGGIIYVETPTERTLKFPPMYGTLNFYDDPTHKKVYTLSEIEDILKRNGCIILESRVRRSLKRIILMPLYTISTWLRDKKINATVLWDIKGFAHYVIAQKQ